MTWCSSPPATATRASPSTRSWQQHYEKVFPWAEHRGSAPLIAHVDAGFAAVGDRIAAGGFDVVHNNSLHRFPLAWPSCRRRADGDVAACPALRRPALVREGQRRRRRIGSRSLRPASSKAWWPEDAPGEVSVLHNGIDLAAWPYRAEGDGSAVWCGRITPNKGTHVAMDAARRAGLPLTIFGTIEDPTYWREDVAPLLGGGIRYGGHIGSAALAGELGGASVFLFTPCWDEPFGLVAVEAMACGVPVASLDMGAAREVIAEAGTFAVTNDAAALAQAIPAALEIPRCIPLARVKRLFTRQIWIDQCEHLYRQVRAEACDAAGTARTRKP